MGEVDCLKWFCRAVLAHEPDYDDLEERNFIHNAVYISIFLGAEWSYSYRWDVRRLVSAKLDADLRTLSDRELDYSPNSKELEVIKKIRPLETLLIKLPIYNKKHDAYELVASVLWMMNNREDLGKLRKLKPWFDEGHIAKAKEFLGK